MRLFTIGIYGWTSASFFQALETAGADAIVDVRARRGVRGADYSFANRRRFEAELSRRKIGYLHLPQLAPSAAIRAAQRDADSAEGTLKRDRLVLDPLFEQRYRSEILAHAEIDRLAQVLVLLGARPALLCVETHPAACHRSLAAERIAHTLGIAVVDLVP